MYPGALPCAQGARHHARMIHPRRTCHICRRHIAVPGGRFARHDPPRSERIPGWPLASCTGSLRQAPPGADQPELFTDEQVTSRLVQPDLFSIIYGT